MTGYPSELYWHHLQSLFLIYILQFLQIGLACCRSIVSGLHVSKMYKATGETLQHCCPLTLWMSSEDMKPSAEPWPQSGDGSCGGGAELWQRSWPMFLCFTVCCKAEEERSVACSKTQWGAIEKSWSQEGMGFDAHLLSHTFRRARVILFSLF